MASGSLSVTGTRYFAYVHDSHAIVRRPCFLSMDDRYNTDVCQVLYDAHALSRDTRAFIEPETGKDIPTQGE